MNTKPSMLVRPALQTKSQRPPDLGDYRWLLVIYWLVLPSIYLVRMLILTESVTLLRDIVALPLIMLIIWALRRTIPSPDIGIFLIYSVATVVVTVSLSVFLYEQEAFSVVRLARIYVLSPLFVLLAKLLRRPEQVFLLIKGMLVIAVISVLYGARQEIFGYNSFERSYLVSSIAFSARNPEYFFRIFSIWGTPSVFAAYLACSFWCLVAVDKYILTGSRIWTIGKIGIGGLMLAGILLSKMRIFPFALLIGGLVYVLLVTKGKIQRTVYLTIGILLTAGVVVYTVNEFGNTVIVGSGVYRSNLQENVDGRLELWLEWIGLALPEPFGLGFDALSSAGLTTPDSSFVDIFIRTGSIGMLLYLFLILRVALVPNIVCALKSTTTAERAFWSAITAMIVSSIISGMTSSVFLNSVYSPYFWLLAGLAFAGFSFKGYPSSSLQASEDSRSR